MNMKLRILKRNEGFTLAELILSVCIMAIVSVYMLQFFISASDLNKRAEDLDQSVFLSNNIIEWIKGEQWGAQGAFAGFVKSTNQTDKAQVRFEAAYDQDWTLVHSEDAKSLFKVVVHINPVSEPQEGLTLYAVTVEITRQKAYFKGKSDNPILYALDSKCYVPTLKEVPNP